MLSPTSMGESDSSDLDLEPKSGPNSLPLGHTSVKNLSNKFQQTGNGAFKYHTQELKNGTLLLSLLFLTERKLFPALKWSF